MLSDPCETKRTIIIGRLAVLAAVIDPILGLQDDMVITQSMSQGLIMFRSCFRTLLFVNQSIDRYHSNCE